MELSARIRTIYTWDASLLLKNALLSSQELFEVGILYDCGLLLDDHGGVDAWLGVHGALSMQKPGPEVFRDAESTLAIGGRGGGHLTSGRVG